MAGSLLHYYTYKIVVIRDKRLGTIYYVVALLILLYTLGEVFVKKGYLEVCMSACKSCNFTVGSRDNRWGRHYDKKADSN